jgi:hypothetical protein
MTTNKLLKLSEFCEKQEWVLLIKQGFIWWKRCYNHDKVDKASSNVKSESEK